MRRVIALSATVTVATFVAGTVLFAGGGAIAQEEEAAPETTDAELGADTGVQTGAEAGAETGAETGADDGTDAAPPAGTDSTDTATSAERDEGMDAGTYAVRLRDLEQRINELKEQIFRSKARLSLLAETVLQGVVAGAQAVIVHENRMSSSYRLVKAVYALDGARIFSKADEEGSLGERRDLDIYDGSIVPGEHTLTVNLEYRGHGYGIFSYLKGYRFRVRSNYSFTAPEGKAITIRVVGNEKGSPTAPLE